MITYKEYKDYIEIVSLNSDIHNQGIGSSLIKKVEELAKQKNYKRIIVVTTNDNINALDFYQKRGYNIIKTYYNSMDEVRKIKPSVPLIGENGIPLNDEIELQKEL